MGKETVRIDKIISMRAAQGDLGALEQSMSTRVDNRILVDDNYRVVDGERQLAIFRKWGWTEVQIIRSSTFEFSLQILKTRNRSGIVTPRRFWEVFQALADQRQERWLAIRRRLNSSRKTGQGTGMRNGQAVEMIGEALGLTTSESRSIVRLFKRQEILPEGDEKRAITETIARMEAGVCTPAAAQGQHRRWLEIRAIQERSGDVEEQRQVLNNSESMLAGMVRALETASFVDPGHDPEDLARWHESFAMGRRVFAQLSINLQKRMDET